MKFKIVLTLLLSTFLGLQLQAQEENKYKNSIGLQSDVVIIENSGYSKLGPPIYYRSNPLLLLTYNRQINDRFSVGGTLGYSGRSIYRYGTRPKGKKIFDENQQHINVELFSRIKLFEVDEFQVYGRPVVGYNLLKKDEEVFYEALNVSADIGLRYTFLNRFNIMLEKELVYFNQVWAFPSAFLLASDSNSVFGLNTALRSFRAGLSFNF